MLRPLKRDIRKIENVLEAATGVYCSRIVFGKTIRKLIIYAPE